MPIDFIQGESPHEWTHIFEKNDNSEKKIQKNKKNVFFCFDKLFHYDNRLRDR